jgi:hypothetical protein
MKPGSQADHVVPAMRARGPVSAFQKKAISMNIAHGELLGAAARATEAAGRAPEVITWYAIMIAILVVTALVTLHHR